MKRRFVKLLKRLVASPAERTERALIAAVLSKNLTYLTEEKLESVAKTVRDIERKGLRGIMVEAGCALGGSTIVMASLKSQSRPLRVYDVFGMIPRPTEQDDDETRRRYSVIESGRSEGIGGDRYYGYRDDLYETVRGNLRAFGLEESRNRISLIRGLLQETMTIEPTVCFAHIDVDWYEPVKTSLLRIVPRLVAGGSVIIDDYHAWAGARKATDEYFEHAHGSFRRDDSAGSLKITRIAGGPAQ
ncbi:MAG TPA: TylF/MycF/NovP-related O-methyltransferase [Thermoanaerobaculia bacterium]